jgi:hypothetical protein
MEKEYLTLEEWKEFKREWNKFLTNEHVHLVKAVNKISTKMLRLEIEIAGILLMGAGVIALLWRLFDALLSHMSSTGG